ncbi:MAG: UDP-N-acetylmuramate--alanine ligase [Candidatus Berkelbacteria bacterium Licking1014_85]|uniref:UDP-N-acetylmuramate--alanine ligase n=1 Tax=Candidatus Berkelbacteria bacterium Licking1014_85 TaxID=2017148 RepID=A0A554LFM7_9BACT|nr:MAG: UDP-N-acetylmuramate--alanine ligase [Candidatus Berkelbacteria bacterium Licking1014_85]
MDVYSSVKEIEKAFLKLIKITQDKVVACLDWQSVRNIIDKCPEEKVITYGKSAEAQWRLIDYCQDINYLKFSVCHDNKFFSDFELRLLGRFNALNAIASLVVAQHCGIDIKVIKEAFRTFSGLERRAIRDKFIKRNIMCIFQPHTASRTLALLDQFVKSFNDVDGVVLVDTFSSAREKETPEAIQKLYEALTKHHPNVLYFGGVGKTAENILPRIKPRDVVITMGAGDVYKIKEYLMENI